MSCLLTFTVATIIILSSFEYNFCCLYLIYISSFSKSLVTKSKLVHKTWNRNKSLWLMNNSTQHFWKHIFFSKPLAISDILQPLWDLWFGKSLMRSLILSSAVKCVL